MTTPSERGRGRRDQPPTFVRELLQERESTERIFEGKTALVIGATRDIGAGISTAFAVRGASVIGIHRDPQKEARAQPVIDAIESCNVTSDFPAIDINSVEDRTRLLQTIAEKFSGQLDFLVLNASVGPTLTREAVVELADELLPIIKPGGKVFLLQSTPAHFSRQINAGGMMPELYKNVADEKYQLWQDLLTQKPKFDQYQATLINICAPLVPETWNAQVFKNRDTSFVEKNDALSDALGLPRTVTIKEIAEKVTELSTRDDLPFGYVEFFGDGVYDARSVLKQWYGDEAIFVDTYSPKEGAARAIVTEDFCRGHFKDLKVCPAHILAEAGTQAAGLIIVSQLDNPDIVPMTQKVTIDLEDGKPVKPGEAITFRLAESQRTRHGYNAITIIFRGDTYIGTVKSDVILVRRSTAERILR